MRRAVAVLLSAVLLGGCGHTLVQTNDPTARIYVNGVYVGQGEAKAAKRTGPPNRMVVEVKSAWARERREVKREFTLTTFLLGSMTYFTGFLWAWQYPETVLVLLPQHAGSAWDEAPSPWDDPPGRWDEGAPRPSKP